MVLGQKSVSSVTETLPGGHHCQVDWKAGSQARCTEARCVLGKTHFHPRMRRKAQNSCYYLYVGTVEKEIAKEKGQKQSGNGQPAVHVQSHTKHRYKLMIRNPYQ